MMYSMAQKLKRSRFKLKKNEGEPIPDIYDSNTENGSLDFFFNLQLRFWEDFHVEYTILKRKGRCFEDVLVILEVV